MTTKTVWAAVIVILVIALGLIYWSYYQGPNASYPLGATSTPVKPSAGGNSPAPYNPPLSGTSGGLTLPLGTSTLPTGGAATSSGATLTFNAKLNQAASGAGIEIMPVKVVEDSRCPVGVYCIQAGTVKLQARVTIKTPTTNTTADQTFTLGQLATIGTDNKQITLTAVSPNRVAGQAVAAGDYVFTFSVRDPSFKP
jgi:hypothetical protein